MSEHTPGPWFSNAVNEIFAGDEQIAAVFGDLPLLEVEANAALIAAAPEMARALKPFVHYARIVAPEIDLVLGDGFYAALQGAKEVLEKAGVT